MQDVLQKTLDKKYQAGFTTKVESETLPPGLDESVVRKISKIKNEPEWLLKFRLKAFDRWKILRCRSGCFSFNRSVSNFLKSLSLQ